MSAFDEIKKHTRIALDTADIEAIQSFSLPDTTTNPSLLLRALDCPFSHALLQRTLHLAEKTKLPFQDLSHYLDCLQIVFASEILAKTSGSLSIQIDPRLSFDTEQTVLKARQLLSLGQCLGLDTKRILIKIIATWEGLQAVKILENARIACNPTVIVSLAQAKAAVESNASMMACYVARVADWHKKNDAGSSFSIEKHPGVQLVQDILQYVKGNGYPTKIMAASFRQKEEILALAGCDFLTISPERLQELKDTDNFSLPQFTLHPKKKEVLSETDFRWQLSESAMASEVLGFSIRQFTKDRMAIEDKLRSHLSA
jgi:transaldolase